MKINGVCLSHIRESPWSRAGVWSYFPAESTEPPSKIRPILSHKSKGSEFDKIPLWCRHGSVLLWVRIDEFLWLPSLLHLSSRIHRATKRSRTFWGPSGSILNFHQCRPKIACASFLPLHWWCTWLLSLRDLCGFILRKISRLIHQKWLHQVRPHHFRWMRRSTWWKSHHWQLTWPWYDHIYDRRQEFGISRPLELDQNNLSFFIFAWHIAINYKIYFIASKLNNHQFYELVSHFNTKNGTKIDVLSIE